MAQYRKDNNMAKFNLHDFVMTTIHKMITSGMEAEYKIMQYALNYYDKGIINDDDMILISEWIEEEDSKVEEVEEEPIEDEPIEEVIEDEPIVEEPIEEVEDEPIVEDMEEVEV